jgi:hypothetical protein
MTAMNDRSRYEVIFAPSVYGNTMLTKHLILGTSYNPASRPLLTLSLTSHDNLSLGS